MSARKNEEVSAVAVNPDVVRMDATLTALGDPESLRLKGVLKDHLETVELANGEIAEAKAQSTEAKLVLKKSQASLADANTGTLAFMRVFTPEVFTVSFTTKGKTAQAVAEELSKLLEASGPRGAPVRPFHTSMALHTSAAVARVKTTGETLREAESQGIVVRADLQRHLGVCRGHVRKNTSKGHPALVHLQRVKRSDADAQKAIDAESARWHEQQAKKEQADREREAARVAKAAEKKQTQLTKAQDKAEAQLNKLVASKPKLAHLKVVLQAPASPTPATPDGDARPINHVQT